MALGTVTSGVLSGRAPTFLQNVPVLGSLPTRRPYLEVEHKGEDANARVKSVPLSRSLAAAGQSAASLAKAMGWSSD